MGTVRRICLRTEDRQRNGQQRETVVLGTEKTGRIVWHDLFTADRHRAMAFYQSVAGWSYQRERAEHFAWGDGAQDYVLAALDKEAGAGMVDVQPDVVTGWIAYVEVADVDAAAALSDRLGGAVVRAPFDVPGVGRNALIRDPNGALIGVSLSRHSFPVPRRQFGPELYLSEQAAFPEAFYAQLCGWRVTTGDAGPCVANASGDTMGRVATRPAALGLTGLWVPGLHVADQRGSLERARASGGTPITPQASDGAGEADMLLQDPDGALIRLL